MTGLPVCRDCPAPVRWVLTLDGDRRAIDPEPHPDGTVALDDQGRARILTGSELPAQDTAYRQHRCSRVPPPRLCRACLEPIDPVAGTLHPRCEPAPRPEATPAPAGPTHAQEELPL